MIELTAAQFETAQARGDARLREPRAVSARYDAGCGRVIIQMTTGMEISFAACDAEGLRHATPDELALIEVEALGLGIHFPQLDADLYLPTLVERVGETKR